MIHFPNTAIMKCVEEVVIEGLKDFVPKNENAGIKKVQELISGARASLVKKGELAELLKTHSEISSIKDPENPDWLGFSYYYKLGEKLLVGLFQLDKKYWEKE